MSISLTFECANLTRTSRSRAQVREPVDLEDSEHSFLKALRNRIQNCQREGMLREIHITLMSSSEAKRNRVKLRQVLAKMETSVRPPKILFSRVPRLARRPKRLTVFLSLRNQEEWLSYVLSLFLS